MVDVDLFFRKAQEHGKQYNAFGVTCQAVQETGWFKSRLCIEFHNYGGIKCRDFWLARGRHCVPIISNEEISGTNVPVKSQFRVYHDLDDYLIELNNKLVEPGTNYKVLIENRNCFWLHFAGLYYGGWATDSGYFGALCDHAVALAPKFFGKEHHQKIRTAYAYALTKPKLLQMWMQKEINRALSGVHRRRSH
jgi:hypothetical protein